MFAATPVSELSVCVDWLFVDVCEQNHSTRCFVCLLSSTYDSVFEVCPVLTRTELHSLTQSIKIPETIFVNR